MEKMFEIKEINNVTGQVSYVKVLKNTSRGYSLETKKFKSMRGAQNWINRRLKELEGSEKENAWTYEIV